MSRFYSNVILPEQFDNLRELREKNQILETQLTIANNHIENLYRVLENIPEAILEFGYVNLTWDCGRQKIKIGKINE
jgi:hypothetical protein